MLDNLSEKRERLLKTLAEYQSCLVAFSGGVDSAVVAKAAFLALGPRAAAVTGESETLAGGELETARRVAAAIGIRHEVVCTNELDNPRYVQNGPDRCYHCKSGLYALLTDLASRLGMAVVANGVNADDLGDYRPGIVAATEQDVKSPLAECGLGKDDVRLLAAAWDLPNADKPAMPCLSSRLAYGVEATAERLAMIDQAERHLRSLGFRDVRVRLHENSLARIEVSADAVSRLMDDRLRDSVSRHLLSLGFRFVSVDLAGFRSGSLNQVLPLESLRPAPSGD